MAKKERKKEEEAKKEEQVSEQETLKKLQEAIDKLTVKDIVTQMIVDLSALAYKKLGLPEETNKKYRDLNQAKQAIDCLSSLVNTLEPDFTQDELRTYKGVVANLKMAYVSQSKTKD
jgi:hypothetical protein